MHSSLRILLAAFIFLFAVDASANRVAKTKAKPTIAGAKVKTWKAKGTSFRHETLRSDGGSIIHWQRSATTRSGVTNFHGVTWGTKIRGTAHKANGLEFRTATRTHADGSNSYSISSVSPTGTKKSLVTTREGNLKSTSWNLGNTRMTDTRRYNQQGELLGRTRRGQAIR